jgi:hypothetical protein
VNDGDEKKNETEKKDKRERDELAQALVALLKELKHLE